MKKTKSNTASEVVELIFYIILGYLIAFGANKGLAYGLDTEYPVVAVISTSMEHADANRTFYSYFDGKNFTMEQVKKLPFSDGIRKGDLMVIRGVDFKQIKVGDVVVYRFPEKEPIIHRVVEAGESELKTKGDNNFREDQEGATNTISSKELQGRAAIRIPLLGYVKITYLKFVKG